MRYSWCVLLLLAVGGGVALAQSTARQAGYLYLSPVPEASYVSPQTRYILLRLAEAKPSEITNLSTDFISVSGASSGPHPGNARVASDGRTVIFEMGTDFQYNEPVSVNLNPQVSGTNGPDPFAYEFMVSSPYPGPGPLAVLPMAPPVSPPADEPGYSWQKPVRPALTKRPSGRKAMRLSNGVSVPGDFPQVQITVNNNPSPGYLFLENAIDVPPYTMMLDNNGLPVWYRKGRMYDFKIQKNGLMTWALDNGLAFQASDQNFNYVTSYATTNGYLTDGHDLKVLADGSYFMIGYQTNTVDMSRYVYGDDVLATVTETVVQEFTAQGELIFQWRAWDNYDLGDEGGNSDFPHMNGVDIDEDGNLLISARHLSEVTKVDVNSGEIIWRLSGAHSDFAFVNDPLNGTSYQHNISALGNNHYMVFDNGDTRSNRLSRAVEYVLDTTGKTATMTWEFRDTPDKYAFWMGNAQRLPTGNTLIDFVLAQYPKAIEVDPSGNKRFELSLSPGADSYRAYRFPWNGVVTEPYLISESLGAGVNLIYNKFGDTNVAAYRVYGGTSPHPTNLLATTSSTLLTISSLNNGLHYFRVSAVNGQGVESPFSNEETVTIDVARPGQNMVLNGDFSQGRNSWSFNPINPATASWVVTNGSSQFLISAGGPSLSAIQFLQAGAGLSTGTKYVLAFDAWSTAPRYIEAALAQAGFPSVNYSHFPASYVTPNRTRFSYTFTMTDPSDSAANLAFYFGGATGDVYLANVKLFSPAPGDFNTDGTVNWLDLSILGDAWLKQQSGLSSDLDKNGIINFNDFRVMGGNWGAGAP